MEYFPTLKLKALGGPNRYYQGPGILFEIIPKIIRAYNYKKPFIISGRQASRALEDAAFFKGLKDNNVQYVFAEFGAGQTWGAECCDEEIGRLTKICEEERCDVVIAAGGGKCIDTGKEVANKMGVDVIIIPTVASQDAPTSSVAVVYTVDHVFKRVDNFEKSPLVVVLDTNIIAKAPPRLLSCGIGDALSKKFEVRSCYKRGANNRLAKPVQGSATLTALNMSALLYDILLTWSVEALDAVQERCVTPALEAIVEATVLLSGLCFESGGLSAAHAIYFGFTYVESKMSPAQNHGELVHFGTCAQLFLEEYSKRDVFEIFKFGHEVGLPESFEELGLKGITDEDLWVVAEKSAEHPLMRNMPMEVSPEMVFNALKAADAYGQRISSLIPRRRFT
ncbi:MAG: glycerol dehydrogenase [Candidatus Bathyarchaeia archaeon]